MRGSRDGLGLSVELDQIAEFAARFPGWATALAGASRRADALERRLVALSDRMTRDPYLLATLHEVQSAVTALRSTASILAETPEIETEWRDRFHRNLDQDSLRLSRTAQALVAYLESFEDDAVPIKPVHKMSQAQIRREVTRHGLAWERTADALPWQHVVVFRKAE